MKWLVMFLSVVLGRLNKRSRAPSLKETALEIFEELIHESRKLVTLTMTAFGAVIFFCAGFFIALLNGTTQYDRSGIVLWTATLAAGVVLMLIAVVTFGVIFLRAWPGIKQKRLEKEQKEELRRSSQQAPLETALSLLVMDFVKEREERREARTAAGLEEEAPRRFRRRSSTATETKEPPPTTSAYH